MGVQLSAGEHDIVFKYTAPGFYPGMLLTILSWGVFIFVLIFHNVKRERAEKAAADRKKKADIEASEDDEASEEEDDDDAEEAEDELEDDESEDDETEDESLDDEA